MICNEQFLQALCSCGHISHHESCDSFQNNQSHFNVGEPEYSAGSSVSHSDSTLALIAEVTELVTLLVG